MLAGDEGMEDDELNGNAAPPSGAAAEKHARGRRRSYVAVRYPEVRELVKGFADEREALSAALAGHGGENSAEAKKLRERRAYVATRLEILRAEQKELAEEWKLGRRGGGKAEKTAKSG